MNVQLKILFMEDFLKTLGYKRLNQLYNKEERTEDDNIEIEYIWDVFFEDPYGLGVIDTLSLVQALGFLSNKMKKTRADEEIIKVLMERLYPNGL